ncbi:MAG TPA: hypothetical protein VNZ49_05905 [Bacteroidia bacterium]|nr:hypothetical protein [Bacteroidia bacterium]
MKKLFFLLIVFSFLIACKSKKKSDSSQPATKTETVAGKHKGKISHAYKESGCAVVIVIQDGSERPVQLIPKDPLPEKFNKDGLLINFNYRLLKMKNPEGCNSGIPAEITDISIAK